MLAVVFIGMSAFNGVTTWVEQIVKPRGFSSTEAGMHGRAHALRRHASAPWCCRRSPTARASACATWSSAWRGRARDTGRDVLLLAAALLYASPPCWASSSSACAPSACSTPPRSPTPRRRARPTASSSSAASLRGLRLRHGGAAHQQRLVHLSLLLSAVLLVGCALVRVAPQGRGADDGFGRVGAGRRDAGRRARRRPGVSAPQ